MFDIDFKKGEMTMNGSTGVIPTFDVSGNGNNNGWGSSMGEWIIGLVALGMLGNGGMFGGFGGNGMGYDFPWILTGQQGINNNTNDGFDTLHLSNQIEGTRDAVNNLSTQLCGSTADVVAAINSGFYGSEIAAANRQMANMQQNFDLSRQFADCCCENRLGVANLGADIAREACATRTADTQNTQALLNTINGGIQSIKDQLCQDKIDAKNDEISQLRQEILYARGQASQIAQTDAITDRIYNELKNCPVGTVPVFGNTPIFSCTSNLGSGCGCTGTSQFI